MSADSDQPVLEAIPLFSLPELKQPFEGGVYCGVTTLPDGQHVAIVKLPDEPDRRLLSWKQAIAWAKSVHGQLPSPAIAAQLSFLDNGPFSKTTYWTDAPRNAHYALSYDFQRCALDMSGLMGELRVFAIRLIPLAEPFEAYELEMRVRSIEARFATAELSERLASLESRLPAGPLPKGAT